jgi:hypothetical protein
MIEKDTQIKELYELKHMNDNIESGFDYEENLITNSFSNVMFQNQMTFDFLNKIKSLLIYTIESNLIARNWFNYTVNKYYNKHNN